MVTPCIFYKHTHKRAGVQACGRAGVQACGRASVDKNEFKRGVISVRAWSIKRAGVEWQSYKARLLYIVRMWVYCMQTYTVHAYACTLMEKYFIYVLYSYSKIVESIDAYYEKERKLFIFLHVCVMKCSLDLIHLFKSNKQPECISCNLAININIYICYTLILKRGLTAS